MPNNIRFLPALVSNKSHRVAPGGCFTNPCDTGQYKLQPQRHVQTTVGPMNKPEHYKLATVPTMHTHCQFMGTFQS